ncbi:hypothetical protein NTE_02734 [Candidatus Nitrososphaera evergladensis SR1]|uniref:SprT-like family n=1 Tax=Candidatus Nitrososphaera evergladensis SR1 TaxID=1459636 RepID=A0A075MT95_9ARCH|nr:hypothetical protein [Candidatus Nitrososphaera evergladensis]AIF84776.1 hypothetical protein NTE_02734 [Candidatus Nitrososphaera evergladensis SR1]
MLRFTRVAEAKFSGEFQERVLKVYGLFPELAEHDIKCGYIRKGMRLLGTARGWTTPKQISLQPNVGRMTIAHELTHLLQGSDGVPHGEKACDIWAVARLPAEMLDEQPYYLLRHWHRERWLRNRVQAKALCERAIGVRRTERNYIKWLSGELRHLK